MENWPMPWSLCYPLYELRQCLNASEPDLAACIDAAEDAYMACARKKWVTMAVGAIGLYVFLKNR